MQERNYNELHRQGIVNQDRILTLLQANSGQKLSVSDISQALKLSSSSVRNNLNQLNRFYENVVFWQKTRKKFYWSWEN
jgi:DNA-binding transcriptional regulator GbsR (MarR family)